MELVAFKREKWSSSSNVQSMASSCQAHAECVNLVSCQVHHNINVKRGPSGQILHWSFHKCNTSCVTDQLIASEFSLRNLRYVNYGSD